MLRTVLGVSKSPLGNLGQPYGRHFRSSVQVAPIMCIAGRRQAETDCDGSYTIHKIGYPDDRFRNESLALDRIVRRFTGNFHRMPAP